MAHASPVVVAVASFSSDGTPARDDRAGGWAAQARPPDQSERQLSQTRACAPLPGARRLHRLPSSAHSSPAAVDCRKPRESCRLPWKGGRPPPQADPPACHESPRSASSPSPLIRTHICWQPWEGACPTGNTGARSPVARMCIKAGCAGQRKRPDRDGPRQPTPPRSIPFTASHRRRRRRRHLSLLSPSRSRFVALGLV